MSDPPPDCPRSVTLARRWPMSAAAGATEHEIRRARDAGFDHHLVKLTDLDAIEALLRGG